MDWKSLLYNHFRTRPQPLTVYENTMVPAATIWTAKRLWVDLFREIGLKPGDRIGISGPPCPAFLAALLAGLWEGLTVALIPPAPEHDRADLDARWIIRPEDGDAAGAPAVDRKPILADTLHPPTPAARMLLRTFGSTGQPKWIALSDSNILSVLGSHLPVLFPHAKLGEPDDEKARNGPVVLSVLPWFHSFGLIVDLLSALFAGTTIIRDPNHGRDARQVMRLAGQYDVTHLSMVPLLARRLAELPGGVDFLHSLKGGVIGGAPITAELAQILRGTKLRVGYGQTEASPGICLGEPGDFSPGGIGSPVGCDVRVDSAGHLLFKGPNASLGTFKAGQLNELQPDRWCDTRDLAKFEQDKLVFGGRVDHDFKLSNGRLVRAAQLETDLRTARSDLHEVAVLQTGDESITLVVCSDVPGFALDPTLVARIFGPLGNRLGKIVVTTTNQLPRTPKGDLDRRAAIAQLTSNLQSTSDFSHENDEHAPPFPTPDLFPRRILGQLGHDLRPLPRVA